MSVYHLQRAVIAVCAVLLATVEASYHLRGLETADLKAILHDRGIDTSHIKSRDELIQTVDALQREDELASVSSKRSGALTPQKHTLRVLYCSG